jgi:hypothetical protein
MTENFWEKELQRESFKEPTLRSKLFWIKPFSHFHRLENRGFDKRDHYEATKYDEWDAQVWNVATKQRGKCMDYNIDFHQCYTYVTGAFPHFRRANAKQNKYCWKQFDNWEHCVDDYGHHHPEYYLKGSKIGHH